MSVCLQLVSIALSAWPNTLGNLLCTRTLPSVNARCRIVSVSFGFNAPPTPTCSHLESLVQFLLLLPKSLFLFIPLGFQNNSLVATGKVLRAFSDTLLFLECTTTTPSFVPMKFPPSTVQRAETHEISSKHQPSIGICSSIRPSLHSNVAILSTVYGWADGMA